MSVRRQSACTRRAYAFDWADFLRWCGWAGRPSLAATSDTVSLYLVDGARGGLAVATLSRRCAAIAYRHLEAGERSPVDVDVREVLAGLRRQLGVAPKARKAALSVEDLRRVLCVLGAGARGARDRALLLVGFASSLRRSELAGLQVGDVCEVGAGLVVRLARSKTDQLAVGREIGVHRGEHAETCPVAAWGAWLVERGAWPGPLFVAIGRAGDVTRRAMSGDAIAVAIKAAVAAAGLDAALYSGHSLRAGMATAAAAAGASDRAIMSRTGHRSSEMVTRYVRHGSLFAVDPLRGVL